MSKTHHSTSDTLVFSINGVPHFLLNMIVLEADLGVQMVWMHLPAESCTWKTRICNGYNDMSLYIFVIHYYGNNRAYTFTTRNSRPIVHEGFWTISWVQGNCEWPGERVYHDGVKLTNTAFFGSSLRPQKSGPRELLSEPFSQKSSTMSKHH